MVLGSAPTLKFLNHAGFKIETLSSSLLIDPWVEGTAFNNSWSLLDKSTSNRNVIADLKNEKSVNVWISHEHSDHFSVKFAKDIAATGIQTRYIYQNTNDKRVINFLKKLGMEVCEVEDGRPLQIDDNLEITTWSFYGDSYCLLTIGDLTILNINDCSIDNAQFMNEAKTNIQEFTENPTILMTQFGYANWIGNEDQSALRQIASENVLKRLRFQIEGFQPKYVVPFASYSYFSHIENLFMNDHQNSPEKVRNSPQLLSEQNKIFFLKPGDELNLDSPNLVTRLSDLTKNAEFHWSNLKASNLEVLVLFEPVSRESISQSAKAYTERCNRDLYYLPALFCLLRLIPTITINVFDQDIYLRMNYYSKPRFIKSKVRSDLSMSSETLMFLFDKEFGFDTLSVSAKFRSMSKKGLRNVRTFFAVQYFVKDQIKKAGPLLILRKFSLFPISKIKTFFISK
jgi:hypothetical protein